MTLRLPNAPSRYAQPEEAQFRRVLEQYAEQNDATIAAANPVQLVKSIPASALLSGAVTTVQYGFQISLPAGALRGKGGLRLRGFWEFINNQASNQPQILLTFYLGGVEVLLYTTGPVPIGGAARVVSFDWLMLPYQGQSGLQAHEVRLLDAAGAASWATLPVDLFAQGPTYRGGLARSAVNMATGQALSVGMTVPSGQAGTFTGQFAGGSLEMLPTTA